MSNKTPSEQHRELHRYPPMSHDGKEHERIKFDRSNGSALLYCS